MKINQTNIVTRSLFTTLIAGTALLQAQALPLSDAPAAVQETIRQNQRKGVLDELNAITVNGRTLYVAEIELGGDRDLHLHVAANGALLKTREDIPLRQAPEAVRQAIKNAAGGGNVDDLDLEVSGDKRTYHADIDRPNSFDLDLVLAEDGAILRQTEDLDD